MAEITVPLSDELTQYVHSQVNEHGLKNAGEYVKRLIDADKVEKTELSDLLNLNRERLDSLLLEGLHSGNAGPLTRETLQNIRDKLRRRHSPRRKEQ